MTRGQRLAASLTVLTLVTLGGTFGYVLIEGASVGDALYMTVLTISTVGFSEVFPLSTSGRILTAGIIIVGIGAALYTAATALEMGLEQVLGGDFRRRRMARDISRLSDHVIVCGLGRVGLNTWRSLRDDGIPTVVIEANPDAVAVGVEEGALVVEGDATRNETLGEAGIDRAHALVACVRNDNDNLVIVLSAKNRRRDLTVIARATELEAEQKLRLAGADRVVSPQLVGAHRLAALATEPRLGEFVDVVLHGRLVELRVESIDVPQRSPLAGRMLRDSGIREHSGAQVLAIETTAGDLRLNPPPDTRIGSGQVLVAIGTEDQLQRLRAYSHG